MRPHFLKHQLDVAERLFEMMRQDFKERKEGESFWIETTKQLMDKLEDRDKEIQRLRNCIYELEIKLKTLES
jgi:hypothetical protein